jgi:phosphohistidine swiveling domain-containing protein
MSNAAAMRVTANTITYYARQNLLEHGWKRALTLIRDEVPGLSTDQAISIFKGEKCFVDDPATPGSIMFVDDPDSSEWLDEFNEKYGSTVEIDRGYYRPYAYVGDYGPADYPDDIARTEINAYVSKDMQANPLSHIGLNVAMLPERAKHYASDPTDKAVFCVIDVDGIKMPVVVLFERSDEPPYWSDSKTPQQAVDSVPGELYDTGFLSVYGTADPSKETDTDRIAQTARMNLHTSIRKSWSANNDDKLEDFLRAGRESSAGHYDERRGLILEQNHQLGYGMRKVDFGERIGVREVPNGPLIYWALNRGQVMKGQGPAWTPISMSGLKQAGDDPVHTDWITGAGLENEDSLDPEFRTIQNDLAFAIQQERLGLTMEVVVAGKAAATGTIKHCTRHSEVDASTIAVVANASIHFERIAREAAAVIVLEGGSLSHLGVVGLDKGFLIIRDKDARTNYPEGTLVTIDINAKRVFRLPAAEIDPEAGPKPPGL